MKLSNVISTTKQRLNRSRNYLENLENSLSEYKLITLTKDARHYIEDEKAKAKDNIKYYEGILKYLEENQ